MREKKLTIQQAKLILSHVGDEFCNLVKNEQMYLKEFKQEGMLLIFIEINDVNKLITI